MVQDRQSFPTQPSPTQKSANYWRWLFPAMVLASIGLHGLVLFVPVAPSEDALVPPPDPDEDGIAITKIEPPQPRTRVTSPANTANPGTVKTVSPNPTPTPARTPQTTQARRASRPAPPTSSPHRSSSSTAGRGRSPAAVARSNEGSAAPPPQPTVPDLSSVDAVQSPNAAPPDVTSPTPDAATNVAAASIDPFEEYIKVFEAYNGVKISEAEATSLRQTWLDSFSDRGADFGNLNIEPLKDLAPLPYEANICLPSPPQPAQVLILVNADGEVDEYKQFVQRTGYRNFDSAASQLITSQDFPKADAPQAYLAEINVDYDPETCDWPPQVDKLPNDYFTVLESYVGPNLTSPAEAEAAQAAWLSVLSQADDLHLPHTAELTAEKFEGFEPEVEYPLAICLPIEPKDAQWGVVVNPDGSLVSGPEQLRSTGYQNFDDRAKELVQTFDFPATEAPKVYVVEVPVGYNPVNCQSLDSAEFNLPATAATTDEATRERPSEAESSGSASADQIAFDPAKQAQLVRNGRQQVEADAVGSLNTLPDIAAAAIEAGWPEAIDQSCFLADLTPNQGPLPVATAEDALILSESFDFVPLTLSRLYGTEIADAGEYCGAPLLEMKVGGVPQLFSSTVGFGAGNSNALVVIWSADPRE